MSPSKPTLSIRSAAAADAEGCFSALTLAFSSDPPSRWVWRDPQQYLAAFPRFARAFGGSAIAAGTAHFIDGFAGVALWLAPGAAPDEEALVNVIQETVDPSRQPAMFSMFEKMGALHPHEPHWHLPLIGVDPAHQGKGIGGALLNYVLQSCDRDQVPAYLEATSERSAVLYARFGFEPVGRVQAEDGPPIIPMLRRAR